MAAALNHFKKDYRTRFCHGGRNKIDVQPGQNVLQLIQDCFESCVSDLTIRSPNAARCSTPIVRNERRTSVQSQGPKAGLTNSVKRASNSAEPLPASPLKPVSSRGWSHESSLKPATDDYVADSKTTKSPVSKRETDNTLKDAEALCKSHALVLDPADDHGSVGSPILVEEVNSSPEYILHFDQNTPAAVKRHVEVENLEGPQTGRDKVVVQGTEHIATSSVQKEKTFSSVVLAAVATETPVKRYSVSLSLPSPPPVKDQDIESECEFLIDESDSISVNSWFTRPHKNEKSKDGSATPVSKSLPSEKKAESKKSKNRKVRVEALTKQERGDLDVGVHDFRGTSESDPVSNSEGKFLKSQRQNSTHRGKTKKDALKQGSPKQKKDLSRKRKVEEPKLSQSGFETETSDAEQYKPVVVPSEDLLMPSSGHQQEQAVPPKKNGRSFRYLQLASKASQKSVHKKQTAKRKLPKDTVANRVTESWRKKLKKAVKKNSNKRPQLQREESSNSESGEEQLEREPVRSKKVFSSPLNEELHTSVGQNLSTSEERENVLQTLGSFGSANKTCVEALQHLTDSVKKSEKKQSSAKSLGKMPKKINRSKGVCTNRKDTESEMDSNSSTVQKMARKKKKLSDTKIKNNKRKHNARHGPQDFFATEKATSHESEPVLEHCDNSEDWNCQLRDLLSDNIARHKIVMPSNTPNVRRTKRIRLQPLEFWRGERVNYIMRPSGGLVINGIVCPKPAPCRNIKWRNGRKNKQKRGETRSEIPASLDHALADTSKPTTVLDPVTNEEVLLECINTESSHSCVFKDESVEIYKNLNTSDFAIGRLILKPLKEKGHQFVHMDTIAFHIIYGEIIVTLHKTSYHLTTGDYFYVPAGNGYNIQNLLKKESVLLFTQLKDR
ncbi:centromere protein C isoform X2 [Tyto alba]|uniref:centromere protein C isoform X2 n=1 Tax=Tyto alba TaxID=56313 RepID=UPI001C66491F|nr:centromere protein C isoform X2 [Tyto alba]